MSEPVAQIDEEPRVRPRGRSKQKVKLYGRDADSARRDFKNQETRFMATELAKFVSKILEKEVNPNFVYSLRTGVELCDLLMTVTRGKVKMKGIHRKTGYSAMDKARYMNNIYKFVRACHLCGIDPQDTCASSDFQGDGNIQPILNNLYAILGIALRNGFEVPESLMHKVKEIKLEPMKAEITEIVDEKQEEPLPEEEVEEEEDDGKIDITVSLPHGGWVDIRISRTEKILRINQILEEKLSVPVRKQVLKFKENLLSQGQSLEEAGIDQGSMVSLEITSAQRGNPFLSPLNQLLIGSALSLLSLISAILALILGTWAYGGDGKETLEYGLTGFYDARAGETTTFHGYEAGLGWDEATLYLNNIGSIVLGMVVVSIIFSLCTATTIAWMVYKKEKKSTDNEDEMVKKDIFSDRVLEWTLDHIYLVPVAGGCSYVIAIVLWSYFGASKSYALSRYWVGSVEVEFSYGSSFLLSIIAVICCFASAALIYTARFAKLVDQLDRSSKEDKKFSTYGAVELVLESTRFQQQGWC